MDATTTGQRVRIVESRAGHSIGPRIAGAASEADVVEPAIDRMVFRDATVCGTSSSVLMGDTIVVERVPSVGADRGDYSAGILVVHGYQFALVKSEPQEVAIERGLFLAGNGSFNFYHWMIEILPRLEFDRDQSLPLLVSEDVSRIPTFREALETVAGSRAIQVLNRGTVYRVGYLEYISSPNLSPFNLRDGMMPRPSDYPLRAESVYFLRQRFLDPRGTSAKDRKRRLFLARKPTRRNYNQDEVFASFQHFGFEMVALEELSMAKQCELVASAELIAGPTGAAWANLAFASPGTRCLCWMAEDLVGFSAYSNLARVVGVDLHYMTYKSDATNTASLYLAEYRLELNDLMPEIRRLVGLS